jgi:hypothetical protein
MIDKESDGFEIIANANVGIMDYSRRTDAGLPPSSQECSHNQLNVMDAKHKVLEILAKLHIIFYCSFVFKGSVALV